MIAVRAVMADDMPLLESWAKRRGCALDAAFLSPHGFLASIDDVPVMCAWGAMILDTPFVEIDHVYVSPRVTKRTGLEAWAALIASLRSWALAINAAGGRIVTGFKIAMNANMGVYAKLTGGHVNAMPKLTCTYAIGEENKNGV